MFDQLQERLNRAAEQKARLDKLVRRATELEEERRETAARVDDLKAALTREESDVERLEGTSLTGLFYTLLGSKEEQLEKERQEALAARLKYDEAVERLRALEREAERTGGEIGHLKGADAEYQELLRQKEAHIAQNGGGELFRFNERAQELNWKLQQLKEAQAAGYAAGADLDRVIDRLDSAKSWGTWDMLGGGMIATMAKHSRMDEAKGAAHSAQQSLASFRRELKDVSLSAQFEVVDLSGFTRFADYFFDGLIVDWTVQNRISDSLASVRHTRAEVESVLSGLALSIKETDSALEALAQERVRFIEQY